MPVTQFTPVCAAWPRKAICTLSFVGTLVLSGIGTAQAQVCALPGSTGGEPAAGYSDQTSGRRYQFVRAGTSHWPAACLNKLCG